MCVDVMMQLQVETIHQNPGLFVREILCDTKENQSVWLCGRLLFLGINYEEQQ